MSSPLTREICGRGVKRSAIPMAIVMWSSSIVPHDEGDFKPDLFVVLQKTEIRANSSTSDFQDEDPASPASRFPDDELIFPAEAPSDEVDHEDVGQAAGGRSLTDGKFLGVLELIDTLTVSTKGLPSIPVGRKENTLFIIQKQRNIDRQDRWTRVFFYGRLWCMEAQPLTSDSNDQEWRKVAVHHLTWGTIWHRKAG
ncbi:hypothetical protein ElyMa_005897300 [Elysia marginata]|uniref:Uncharacterized protein n=1 Tax=Elysia marginata TaxID=1093978 RepID=A0AAV4G4C1_9GAST|nr:hypothetical protein ElyMa_005897300 [Elysia marginata]